MTPASTMTTEITVEKTGRSTKNSTTLTIPYLDALEGLAARSLSLVTCNNPTISSAPAAAPASAAQNDWTTSSAPSNNPTVAPNAAQAITDPALRTPGRVKNSLS